MRRLVSPALLSLAALLIGCPDEEPAPDAGTVVADAGVRPDAAAPDAPAADAPRPDAPDAGEPDAMAMDAIGMDAAPQAPEDCDPLQPEVCALPWPSNLYLVPTKGRQTGFTLTFGPTTLPANVARQRIDPSIYRRLDGYGVGEPILVLFPNLDVSMLPDEYSIEGSLDANAQIQLFHDTGKGLERVPYFAELDSQEADPARRLLIVRPALILAEGARYLVALQNLRDTSGALIAPSEAFMKLVTGSTAGDPLLAPRQARFDDVFNLLETTGLSRGSLTLAWDFNTASCDAMHGNVQRMILDALLAAPDGPPISITSSVAYIPAADGSGRPVDPNIAYEFRGVMRAPNYLKNVIYGVLQVKDLNLGANGRPAQNGTLDVPFWVRVPHNAVNATVAHSLMLYGHGLLGSGEELRRSYHDEIARREHFIYFAADLMGMSERDELVVGAALVDLSAFRFTGDVLHQGLLNYVLLARAMFRQFGNLPEVSRANIFVDPYEVYYSGISQGGIFGASFMALSPDVVRGHLGVPGQNYGTLLHRSVDFTPFFDSLRMNYASPIDQIIGLALVELQWTATEPVGYYRHITREPFGYVGQQHHVLAAPAKGDHQVSVMTMEVVARSGLDIPILEPYDDERTVFGVQTGAFPNAGSGIVLYDFGNPWPAAGNKTPDTAVPDPHGLPRRLYAHQRQMAIFLRTGVIEDVCGGDGCHPD